MISRLILVFIFFISTLTCQAASACTRILWTNSGEGVLVGRTMDWPARSAPKLWIFPRGMQHSGTWANPLNWTSRYGSIVTSAYDSAAIDGMNEKGLAAHMLWLDEGDYGERDLSRQGLALSLWAQYYLDNFSSVREAVEATQAEHFQLLATYYPPMNRWMRLHLALEDASGDSAIIEYTQTGVHIYHDPGDIVLTNSPVYPEELKNLKNYKDFGGTEPLPGSGKPSDRFVRATYYAERLPQPQSYAEAIIMLTSVMDNVSQPFRRPLEDTPNSPTDWIALDDLTHLMYYFSPTDTGKNLHVDLNKMNFQPSASVMSLNPLDAQFQGDVSDKFTPTPPFNPMPPT